MPDFINKSASFTEDFISTFYLPSAKPYLPPLCSDWLSEARDGRVLDEVASDLAPCRRPLEAQRVNGAVCKLEGGGTLGSL